MNLGATEVLISIVTRGKTYLPTKHWACVLLSTAKDQCPASKGVKSDRYCTKGLESTVLTKDLII